MPAATQSKTTRKRIVADAKANGIECGAWFYRCNGRLPIRSAKTYAAIVPGKMSHDELTIEWNANDHYQRFLADNDIRDDDESIDILGIYCKAYETAALSWRP